MRTATALVLLGLAVSASAREWKSEIFHCAANIPDSTGWQMIEAPQTPGITVVLVMQHPVKRSVFGINIVEKYRDASLADPAVQKDLEAMLRQLGYQFVGRATVKAGGFDWVQYPVRAGVGAQQVSGLIRFTAAGGYIFSITMLRGGGQEASQDAELQQAAASFRMLPSGAAAAPTASAVAPVTAPSGLPRVTAKVPPFAASAVSAKEKPADNPASEADRQDDGADPKRRYIWYALAGVAVLAMFFGIVGAGKKTKR